MRNVTKCISKPAGDLRAASHISPLEILQVQTTLQQNSAEHDPNHPSFATGTTSTVAGTTSKDINTSSTADELTPATTVPLLTDPNQSSINHPNHHNQSDNTSVIHETSINHSNSNDSVEDETTHAWLPPLRILNDPPSSIAPRAQSTPPELLLSQLL